MRFLSALVQAFSEEKPSDWAAEVRAVLTRVRHKLRLGSSPWIPIPILVGLILASLTETAFGVPVLRIDSALPQPNYPLTMDAADLRQLTDGVLVEYPAWTKRGSVGWSWATPVLLMGHLIGTVSASGKRIKIQVRTAKGESAGVLPPAGSTSIAVPGVISGAMLASWQPTPVPCRMPKMRHSTFRWRKPVMTTLRSFFMPPARS